MTASASWGKVVGGKGEKKARGFPPPFFYLKGTLCQFLWSGRRVFFLSLLVSLSLWSCLLLLLHCYYCDKSASLGQGRRIPQGSVGWDQKVSPYSLCPSPLTRKVSLGPFSSCACYALLGFRMLSLSWEIEEDNKTKQNRKLTTIFFLEF